MLATLGTPRIVSPFMRQPVSDIFVSESYGVGELATSIWGMIITLIPLSRIILQVCLYFVEIPG